MSHAQGTGVMISPLVLTCIPREFTAVASKENGTPQPASNCSVLLKYGVDTGPDGQNGASLRVTLTPFTG